MPPRQNRVIICRVLDFFGEGAAQGKQRPRKRGIELHGDFITRCAAQLARIRSRRLHSIFIPPGTWTKAPHRGLSLRGIYLAGLLTALCSRVPFGHFPAMGPLLIGAHQPEYLVFSARLAWPGEDRCTLRRFGILITSNDVLGRGLRTRTIYFDVILNTSVAISC